MEYFTRYIGGGGYPQKRRLESIRDLRRRVLRSKSRGMVRPEGFEPPAFWFVVEPHPVESSRYKVK